LAEVSSVLVVRYEILVVRYEILDSKEWILKEGHMQKAIYKENEEKNAKRATRKATEGAEGGLRVDIEARRTIAIGASWRFLFRPPLPYPATGMAEGGTESWLAGGWEQQNRQ
jgi:hypothetical protein